MRLGNLSNKILLILFGLLFMPHVVVAQVDLQNIQPTFEEESEVNDESENLELNYIKSKKKKEIKTNETVVNLRALDKITAKTLDINIEIGKKKKFGYLEILPKNCKRTAENNDSGVVAYLQVKDLSDKSDKKVFVFNGWTFSTSPTLRPFDHPVYDLWLTGCENI
tara:strand:+ start:632 stop:1129 length:498 start_codon:yes stop_codon:yes gene_type:complete